MNISHAKHLAVAIFCQILIGLLSGNWWAGAAFGSALFIGREHAQAQERARKQFARRPEYVVFKSLDYWSVDSILDFVLPILVTTLIAILVTAANYGG